MIAEAETRSDAGARSAAEISAPRSGAGGLRDFIQALDADNRLVRISRRVHWNLEVGLITRQIGGPILFENIEGYPGWRIFTNGLCDEAAIALALGMDEAKSLPELSRQVKKRLHESRMRTVASAPGVPEGFSVQGEIDLRKLSVPIWHPLDAGRYLGTWHINVTKDPESGARNVGVYRMQLLDERQATVNTAGRSHLGRHMEKAEREGRPLEMAVAIGVPEPVMIAASAAYPQGCDEYELAAALTQAPVELMRCRTVNLEVPAQSEIVIEGVILPHARVQDGPFFDYSGVPNTNPRAYLFEVTSVMTRENAIFRGTSVGQPGAEDHQLFAFLSRLGLLDFHGSRLRHRVQNLFLRRGLFGGFQLAGKSGQWLRRKR